MAGSTERCSECGGKLKLLGEDVAEQLEYVPASFRVIRHVRPKFACACCDHIAQAAAPSRPIERGLAGPGLLAYVLVSKFADHIPLSRQSVMYAREGVELDRSLLAKWVGHGATLLQPLVDALRRHVMTATKLHADDTPVPVLEPGNGKTKTGRLWVYVRDDRSSADTTSPAVWFAYTPDRKGIHPQQHLDSFSGTLQADAYGGYQAIYETGRVKEAACWAHARRQFYELHAARPNALNTEALERIRALYKIEDAIRGKPPDERCAYREAHARPLLDQLHAWLTATLETLSKKSDTGRAILYALNRWEALTRYCDDGRLEIDNLPVERALRGVPSEGGTTSLPARTPAVNVPPRFTASSGQQNSMTSIPRHICASYLPASLITRSTASTSSCRGPSLINSATPTEHHDAVVKTAFATRLRSISVEGTPIVGANCCVCESAPIPSM